MGGLDDPDWVTLSEAARRLGMSVSYVKDRAAAGDLVIVRRGRQGGVNWTAVERWIAYSRVTHRVNDALLRAHGPPREPRGVGLLDLGSSRFGWSDAEIGGRLNVSVEAVARWRARGVPNHYVSRRSIRRWPMRHGTGYRNSPDAQCGGRDRVCGHLPLVANAAGHDAVSIDNYGGSVDRCFRTSGVFMSSG